MRYYAYLVQKGEGCDYTIGCGNTIRKIEASNDKEASEKLSNIIEEEYRPDGDFELSKVILLKEEVPFNLNDVYSKARKNKETSKSKRQHIKDMEEFEKLKKKLGK